MLSKLPLLISLFFLSCTSQTHVLTPVVEPGPKEKVEAPKTLLGSALNRPLPISSAEINKLLAQVKANSSCAALYQQLISRGLDSALDSWQRRDLNFHVDCLPPDARQALILCEGETKPKAEAALACQKVMGLTRSYLIGTLLENDARPLVASLKAAHRLYALQDKTREEPEAVLEQTEILLRYNPRDLDAHLYRTLVLEQQPRGPNEEQALATSRRWLSHSSEKRHRSEASF